MTIELYPYQQEDVARMRDGVYFLNANEPGTGKTYEALFDAQKSQRTLIVCPNSVKGTWENAGKEVVPWAWQTTLSGPTKARLDDFSEGLCIVNWEALRLIPELEKRKWDYVIADEGHAIKNRKTQQTRALKRIKNVKYKRLLTGTPIINKPDELWSLLNWLDRKTWSSYWKFYNRYVDWVDSGYGYKITIGSKNEAELWERIAPFTSRRLKKDVLPQLPDKYITFMPIELHPKQAKAYKEMKKTSLAWLEQQPNDQPLPAPTVLAQLTRLRQFASAYCELYGEDDKERIYVRMSEPSSKLDALEDIMAGRNGPVVVFSQFKQLIYLARDRLKAYDCAVLTGDTPQGARAPMIAAFQQGHYDAFLATIQAGGVGIDLFVSSTCVFLDRAWSPAYNTQAEDRLHRNGQKNAVQVIVMQSVGTVDLVIERKLVWKASLVRNIIDRK